LVFSPPKRLKFGYRDRPRGTNLDATLAPETFIFIHRHGFFVLHFEDAYRADVNALFVARTFVSIDFNTPSHKLLPPGKIAPLIALVNDIKKGPGCKQGKRGQKSGAGLSSSIKIHYLWERNLV
jgi:hypothetical protein